MKRYLLKSAIIFVSLFGSYSSAFADAKIMACKNPATQSELMLVGFSSRPLIDFNGPMSEALNGGTRLQGETNWIPSDFKYYAGYPGSDSLSIRSDQGGIRVEFTRIHHDEHGSTYYETPKSFFLASGSQDKAPRSHA